VAIELYWVSGSPFAWRYADAGDKESGVRIQILEYSKEERKV
jgi:hypothetical protein